MGKRVPTTDQVISSYESFGMTAKDALKDARTAGYKYNYEKGFAHGAIAAAIGAFIGGAIDLTLANRYKKDFHTNLARRTELSYMQMKIAEANKSDAEKAREENNE